MIPIAEIRALRAEWRLRDDIIEKDYVLGWLLASIAVDPALSATWVFKGGTCLRKCYYETYRFSEDLDFTVIGNGPEEPADLVAIFRRIGEWLLDRAGIALELDDRAFVRRRNRRDNFTSEGRISFRGPIRWPQPPKVKFDLTSDEVLVHSPVRRPVLHPYGDGPLPVGDGVLCYTLVELQAEKLRALAERCRPRDLYDVVNIFRHPDLLDRAPAVMAAVDRKCAHAGIPVPTAETIRSSPYREEIQNEWQNMLAHQLPHLPPFSEFWNALEAVFTWLRGERVIPRLRRAERGDLDPTWVPPRAMASWRRGAPLELIRFAGSNRLKVEIDYHAEDGRQGPRVIEPYSFRMTRDGNLLLFVVNDQGQLRSYRIDRIAGARVTDLSFDPRYLVEF